MNLIRSSGPGGQNINKVASAVQLRFNAEDSPSLPNDFKTRLRNIAGSRMTSEGILIIEAKKHRTQEQNRREALLRLVNMLRRASYKPKARKQTRPTRGSQERRIQKKKQHGRLKKLREKPNLFVD